jgi:hypothetical protein
MPRSRSSGALARRFALLTVLALIAGKDLFYGAAMAQFPVGGVAPPQPSKDSDVGARTQAGAGPCPNTTGYAFDPRTNKCVALQSCQNGLIWNPDKNECVPRPPGGVLECLDGYGFSTKENKCIPPNCQSGLEFSASQAKCIPAQPTKTYAILDFVIGTGGDDLRNNSAAGATFTLPNVGTKNCLLKASGIGSFDAGSSHTVPCQIGPTTLAQLKNTQITIQYNGMPGQITDSQDNWDMQSITINAYNMGETPVCVFGASGNPLFRFQGSSPSVVVTNYPTTCP